MRFWTVLSAEGWIPTVFPIDKENGLDEAIKDAPDPIRLRIGEPFSLENTTSHRWWGPCPAITCYQPDETIPLNPTFLLPSQPPPKIFEIRTEGHDYMICTALQGNAFVRAGIPVREIPITRSIRTGHDNPAWALHWAMFVDRRDEEMVRYDLRDVACREPEYALDFAVKVDQGPGVQTWLGVRDHPEWRAEYLNRFPLADRIFENPKEEAPDGGGILPSEEDGGELDELEM